MMSAGPADTFLYLFETSTHVLWAEGVALECGIPVEVVPAPAEVADVCGLALRTFLNARDSLETLLRDEGIPFRPHG